LMAVDDVMIVEHLIKWLASPKDNATAINPGLSRTDWPLTVQLPPISCPYALVSRHASVLMLRQQRLWLD